LLLGEHKFFAPHLLDLVGDLAREFGGGSSLFGIEGETAEMVETRPFDEIEQFVKPGIRFAGETDNQGCPKDTVGQAGPQPFDERADSIF